MLTENAFAVLDAMPGDSRRVLNNKADDAALLGGDNTDAALNQLMQMNRRIAAEVRWLPGATAEAASRFLSYNRAIAGGQRAAIPSLDGLGTALAQANALALLFEQWPTDQPELFNGLCRALDGILSQVTVEDTMAAINADRAAGGWEPIPDLSALTTPLEEHLRELCAPAGHAVERMQQSQAAPLLAELLGPNGIDSQGCVAQAICDAYLLKIHEEANSLKAALLLDVQTLINAQQIQLSSFTVMKNRIVKWCALTAPLQRVPGPVRNDMKAIGLGFRNAVVDYVNKSGVVQKTTTVRVLHGTVTINYNSRQEYVNNALDLHNWMLAVFFNHSDVTDQVKEDIRQFRDILKKEDDMLSHARQEAMLKFKAPRS
ncbi:MAG: hypothetical protein ACI4O7_15740 [Aristaeellaceae bacterium]